jgi:hypothetical protein
MSENRDSCDMRRVERDWKSWDRETRPQVGDFQITPNGDHFDLVMMLPGENLCRISVSTGAKRDGAWQWDGNEDRPTLSPSVDLGAVSPRDGQRISIWHGWIRAGRMESC